MAKLTKRLIDATPFPRTGQVFLRDDNLKGFALRLTPGSKTFVLEKRIHGRPRRMTLGSYGALTVEQARIAAQEKLGQVALGEDPAQARQDQHKEWTFADLESAYLSRHGPYKKASSLKNDRSLLKWHLHPWRPRKLSAITHDDVTRLHSAMGGKGTPTHANHAVRLVRTMFNKALEWGTYRGPNPAVGVKFFDNVKRDRFLHPDELPRFFAALKTEANIYIRSAFLTSLLTGARKMEVLTLKWEDLHFDQGLWYKPNTKSGEPQYLPLPVPLQKLLLSLPRLTDNPYVFPSRVKGQHLKNVYSAWYRILKEAKLENVRIHDLRRTMGSWLTLHGETLSLVGKVLNHRDPATTAIYARLELEPVRAALDSTAAKMLAFGELPNNAVIKTVRAKR
jgi:integrase